MSRSSLPMRDALIVLTAWPYVRQLVYRAVYPAYFPDCSWIWSILDKGHYFGAKTHRRVI
jgi:hypothetical protein